MSLKTVACVVGLVCTAACGLDPTGYSAPYPPPQPFAVVVPKNAPSISQQFRRGIGADHIGTDFIAAVGTPVVAAAAGRVTRSFFDPAYGHTIELTHGQDRAGRPIVTRYAHLETRSVAPGTSVQRGQHIGTLGRSGVLAGGIAHLHFEVWIGKRRDPENARDPNTLWALGTGRVTCFDPGRRVPADPFRITHPVACK
ncbi:MAG: M23 family metallopeptidase [Pseudomonadota bacterium]